MYLLKSDSSSLYGSGYDSCGDGYGDGSSYGSDSGNGSGYSGGSTCSNYQPEDAMVQLMFRLEVRSWM